MIYQKKRALKDFSRVSRSRFYRPYQALFLVATILTVIVFCAEDPVLSAARAFARDGSFFESQTEYERYLFFNATPSSSTIRWEAACCYFLDNQHEKALRHLEKACHDESDDILLTQFRLTTAAILIPLKRTPETRKICREIIVDSISSEHSLTAQLLIIVSYLLDPDIDSVYHGIKTSPVMDSSINSRLIELQNIAPRPHQFKSSRLSRVLSALLPGSGQFYCGRKGDGINALMVNGVVVSLLAMALYTQNWADVILYFSLAYRFYRGNIQNAQLHAEDYNAALINAYRNTSLKLFRSLFQPTKIHGNDTN